MFFLKTKKEKSPGQENQDFGFHGLKKTQELIKTSEVNRLYTFLAMTISFTKNASNL